MRRYGWASAVACAAALSLVGGSVKAAAPREARPASYKDLKYPPLRDVKVPEATRFELANGLVVYLMEDHELPKAAVHLMVRAGSRWEPADKAGLAAVTAAVMRTGGTRTESGDKLDDELDGLGASVEIAFGQDSGGAFARVLKEDLGRGIDIVADLIQHPAFPEDKIELAKIQERDSIARRNDDPSGIAFRELNRILYGPESPYARQTEYATIDAITRDDLLSFHGRFCQPETAILGVVGDFRTEELRPRIEQAFGAWPRGGQAKAPAPEVDATSHAGFYSITKDDMQQSWVIMGALSGRRDDPDFYALQVMNEILGGGFSSRLFSNVRSAEGLAYAVYSAYDAEWDHPGTFLVGGSSKPETTVKIYESMRREVERLAAQGATPDELSRAKDSILKGFAFEFDEPGKIITRLMTYEYYGYPRDYLEQYHARIRQVSRADVSRVAGKYLTPATFAALFVGPGEYEKPLGSLGPVKAIDIAIPGSKADPPADPAPPAAASPSAPVTGKELLLAARAAMGGGAVLGVKELSVSGEALVQTPQGPMPVKSEGSIDLAGGRVLQKMKGPQGEMTVGFDGKTVWMSAGGRSQEMPDSQRAEVEGSIERESLRLLQRIDDPKLRLQALDPITLDGRKVDVVALSEPEGRLRVKLFLDPASHLIVGKQFTAAVMGPPAETEELYSDYRDVSGVKLPFKVATRQGKKTVGELTVSEVKINQAVPESAYRRPQP